MSKPPSQIILNEMGFKNLTEFLTTAFGLYYKKLLIGSSLVLGVFSFVLAQLDTWVNKVLYSPSVTLYTLLAMIVLDWMSATIPAILKKEFETNKAKRLFPVAVAHILLLAIVFHAEASVIAPAGDTARAAYNLFRLALTHYIFFVYLLSAVSNAGRHGYINTKIVRFITDYVDRHKQQKS